MTQKMKRKYDLSSPILTHMRAVAYAPVILKEEKKDEEAAKNAAKAKRQRKMAKRKGGN